MSETPPESPEVEEGSPFGGAECHDSSPEPAQQLSADQDQEDESVFPYVNVSVELYEGPEYVANAKNSEQNNEITNDAAPMSPDVENIETTPDLYLHMDDDGDAKNINTDSVNKNSVVSYTTVIKSDPLVPDYQNLQKTSIENFLYILPNELPTGSHKLPMKYGVDNKAAERSRLYREKHREEINQRRRDIRQRKRKSQLFQTLCDSQKITEMQEITKSTLNNQMSTNSRLQRQRRYYERHREEINKRKRESRLKQNISPRVPASAAERSRKYRERNKQKINEQRRYSRLHQQNAQKRHTECVMNTKDSSYQITNET